LNASLTGALVSGATSLAASGFSASAERENQKLRNQIDEHNARIREINAKDASFKGQRSAEESKRRVSQIQAEQALAGAAQGVDITSGNASEILDETQRISEADALSIRNNAYREAFGLKVDAFNIRTQNTFDRIESKTRQTQTLTTAGFNFANNLNNVGLSRQNNKLKALKKG